MGGTMNKQNLHFDLKVSNPITSMLYKTLRWPASLLTLALLGALVTNGLILDSHKSTLAMNSAQDNSRSIASVRLNADLWESKAFEILENTESRELASVGQKPSALDQLVFADLEGRYQVRKIDNEIFEIRWNGDSEAQHLSSTQDFMARNLHVISPLAKSYKALEVLDNSQRVVERYQIFDSQGKSLAKLEFLLDQKNKLLSMTRF